MILGLIFLGALWTVLLIGSFVSILSAFLRKWRFAYKISLASFRGAVALSVITIGFFALIASGALPDFRNVSTDRAISEGIRGVSSWFAQAAPVFILSGLVWRISRNKLEGDKREGNGE